jgi:hypothetical protein
MKKTILALLLTTLLVACNSVATEVTTDSTATTVSTDTTAVVADSTAQTTDSVVVK